MPLGNGGIWGCLGTGVLFDENAQQPTRARAVRFLGPRRSSILPWNKRFPDPTQALTQTDGGESVRKEQDMINEDMTQESASCKHRTPDMALPDVITEQQDRGRLAS